ncbi:MAG: AarF/UbiB family protein [Acidianus sp.]|uniref:ABC1 kinase family protein n=1 Tax=Acidianus sp. TaxID=1872104 RepID=UPI0039793847
MFRTFYVGFKLLPRVLMLRHYRRLTLENKKVDEKEVEKEAEKLLNALVSLGPAFIKLGQILSVHSDLLPEAYLKVLSRLQDSVPPAPWEEVYEEIKEDLGDELLKRLNINPSPIASASIAQVYLAELDSKKVVLKVNRPNIKKEVEEDIKVMKTLVPFLKYIFDESFYESAKAIIDDFSSRIFDEMDFTKEEFYMRKIKEELNFPDVKIPQPIYATKRVLIMEYVKSYKVTSEEAKKIIPPDTLSYKVFRTFMVMLLEKEYFHADPHPGNIGVDDEGNLVLYDFGMVGKMDKDTRNKLVRAYVALTRLDGIELVKVLDELGAIQPEADRELLAKGIELFLKTFQGVTPETLEVEDFISAANEVFYRFPLRLPQKLVLYIRTTSTLGGTCITIYPEFNFFSNLVKLIEDEDLVIPALIDQVKDTLSSFVRKFRTSLLERPVIERKNNTRGEYYLSLGIAILSILSYIFTKDVTLALLLIVFALIIKR